MKKFLLIVFLCLALCACIVACDVVDENSDGAQTDDVTTETPTQTPYEIHENPIKQVTGEEIEEEIRSQLSNYLYSLGVDYGLIGYTFEDQINSIKKGARPILVSFDSKDCYYVCAYYSTSDDHLEGIGEIYCCVDNYTWVKFDKATDIPESYNDEKLIAAFQMNGAALSSDLLSKEIEVPIIYHFRMFEPEFTNGFNIKELVEFNNTYIYLYGSDRNVVLFCTTNILTRASLIDCIYYENEYYISNMIKKEFTQGEDLVIDLKEDFGEYYDYLTGPSREKIYEETNSREEKTYYLLTDLESLISIVKQ